MAADREEWGNVIVFTGSGKGKTTAALGLACRAVGHGGKAAFIHFSGPARPSLGDVLSTKVLGHDVRMIAIESQAAEAAYVDQFDESVATVEAALHRARELAFGGECDVLILDDINPLLHGGIVEESFIVDLISSKPEAATIILTGRFAPEAIVKIADVVTDFAEVKHPARVGVGPRMGIDF